MEYYGRHVCRRVRGFAVVFIQFREGGGILVGYPLKLSSKVSKIALNKVVSLMNNRASIAMSQRAGRKRRQGKRGNQATESSSTEAEDIIEVDESGGSARRQRIESPSLRVMTRRSRQRQG
jgi:hypothetical protein